MLATIQSVKAALDQISNYFDKEISAARTVALWDGLSIQVSSVANRDEYGNMHIVVRVVLDGWTPSEPALVKNVKVNGSKDIPVTEDGFVDPENVLEEIAKVVDSISLDYHDYMD